MTSGIVVTPTDRVIPGQKGSNGSAEDDVEAEPEEPVKILEKQNTFDEFMVWGHESIPAADDPYVKGVEEWLKLAEAVCSLLLCCSTFSLTRLKMNSSTAPITEGNEKSSG